MDRFIFETGAQGFVPELGEALQTEEFQPSQEEAIVPGIRSFRHPRLGRVWSVPRSGAGEFEDAEAPAAYRHPRLGRVWSVPRTGSGELGELELIGADDRRAVLDTTTIPNRWICQLEMNFGPDPTSPGSDLLAKGTGTLISSRHVLTCGHNVYDDFSDVQPGLVLEAKSIRVTPGYNCAAKKAAPLGWTTSRRVNYPGNWRSSLNEEFDFALITLASPIGDQLQPALGGRPLAFWGSKELGAGTRIIPRAPRELAGRRVYTTGYPGDKCCFKPEDPAAGCRWSSVAAAQFRASGKVTNGSPAARPRLILYTVDTVSGQSGSPVWIFWQQYRNLAAIHTGPGWVVDPAERGRSNRGVRITEDVLREVRGWMR